MKRTSQRGAENEIVVVLTCEETRPINCQNIDNGDGTTWEKKKRETKAQMDGLCQLRHERHRDSRR